MVVVWWDQSWLDQIDLVWRWPEKVACLQVGVVGWKVDLCALETPLLIDVACCEF